jgi:uncharacterized protein (TIGR01244 family)
VKTVINLRVEHESPDQIDPVDEGNLVREAGMEYLHIPVIGSQIREGQVDEFRNAVSQLPKPIFVHCQKGKRAGVLAMMDQGVRNRWSGKETIAKAREAGLEIDDAALVTFIREYVDSRKA